MVTAAGSALVGRMPDEVLAALADPPVWEKRVLELSLEWPDLGAAQVRVAGRLQVFLLTWDPFEWRPGRSAAFATATSRSDGFGLVLYVPLWRALAAAASETEGLPGALGRLGESVISVGTEHEAAVAAGGYLEGVLADTVPDLLSRVPVERDLGVPAIKVVGDGWRPIEFDVLEDLAQDIFGPADLDRSPVVFKQLGGGREGCVGCSGATLTFPDGLKDAQATMCSVHRAEALKVTTARLERAKASNPAGWEALLEAGQHLVEPHLPNGLGPRLVAAAAAAAPSTADLQAQAALVLEAAGLMTGLPDPQSALGGQLADVRTWLSGLPEVLSARGFEDQAADVAAAAAELLASAPPTPPEEAAPAPAVPPKAEPIRVVRISRNGPCTCGSGKKHKYCCGR